MLKRTGRPILVMVGLVFLGGWSAKAEPPATLSTDEVTQEDATLGTEEIEQEDGSGTRGSRTPSPEYARTHEHELQEDREAVHQHGADTHEKSADWRHHDSATDHPEADTRHPDSDMHQRDADTHRHDSGTGEHTKDAEGMGSHSGMHEMGRMGSAAEGNHGGRMRGGH